MRPVEKGTAPQRFTDYKQALPHLIERLGRYCSYCERRINNQLAVEHVQPKSHRDDLKLNWDNFLLACANCNATKGDDEVALDDYYWPDKDNTFRAFVYTQQLIRISDTLDPEQALRAQRTLELTGLDRIPGHPNLSERDYRWRDRLEVWGVAERAKARLQQQDTKSMREQIVETAQSHGFWSIWMAVFADNLDMLARLSDAFPGTCHACFEAEFRPVQRRDGAL